MLFGKQLLGQIVSLRQIFQLNESNQQQHMKIRLQAFILPGKNDNEMCRILVNVIFSREEDRQNFGRPFHSLRHVLKEAFCRRSLIATEKNNRQINFRI